MSAKSLINPTTDAVASVPLNLGGRAALVAAPGLQGAETVVIEVAGGQVATTFTRSGEVIVLTADQPNAYLPPGPTYLVSKGSTANPVSVFWAAAQSFGGPALSGGGGGGDAVLAAMLAESPIIAYDNNDLTAFRTGAGGYQQASINGDCSMQFDKSLGMAEGTTYTPGGFVDPGATFDSFSATATGFTGTKSTAGGNDSAYTTDTFPVTLGKWYRITIAISANSLTQVQVNLSSGVNSRGKAATLQSAGTGTFDCYVLANVASGNFSVLVSTASLGTITVDSVSVREVAGHHRYQDTAASRPVLRGTPTGSTLVTNGDFSGGTTDWTAAFNSTISVVSGRLRVTATGSTPLAQQAVPTVIGHTYRVRARYTPGTATTPVFRVGSGSISNNLVNLANASSVGTNVDRYFVATTTTSYINFGATVANVGDYTDWDDIELHDVSADAVAAPYFLHYDGVDDFMQTAAVDFTATDAVTSCAGLRKLSDAAIGVFFEVGTNFNTVNGSFAITAPGSAGVANSNYVVRGSLTAVASAASFAAPSTAVITGLSDISDDVCIQRRDGVQVASSVSDQGTGNYSNLPIYFGRRAGSSFPFGGYDYGPCIFPAPKSGAGLDAIEAFAADRTGVTL